MYVLINSKQDTVSTIRKVCVEAVMYFLEHFSKTKCHTTFL